jgi:hypothetical protein
MKKSKQIDKKIFVLPNADKDDWREELDHNNLCNFRRSFKMLISGRPSSGKTNLIKSIIIHQEPAFDDILICHLDKNTKEYDDTDGKMIDVNELPEPEDIEPDNKLLVILEDADFDALGRREREKINKYLRYVCSHRGLSFIIACQDPFCVPPTYRKKIDIYILFRFDPTTISILAKKCESTKEEFKYLFDKHITGCHDNLCVDLTGSPYLIRKNIFEVLRKI